MTATVQLAGSSALHTKPWLLPMLCQQAPQRTLQTDLRGEDPEKEILGFLLLVLDTRLPLPSEM